MNSPKYDHTIAEPLRTDQSIENRVSELIGRANIRQLWLLFLDANDVQLPLLIPIDHLQAVPSDDEVDALLSTVTELRDSVGAQSVVVVWERYGSRDLTARDAAWARSLHAACDSRAVSLRGTLLSYRNGVRWISPHEYGGAEGVGTPSAPP